MTNLNEEENVTVWLKNSACTRTLCTWWDFSAEINNYLRSSIIAKLWKCHRR